MKDFIEHGEHLLKTKSIDELREFIIKIAILAMNMVFAVRILLAFLQKWLKLIFQAKFEEIHDEWSKIMENKLSFVQ